MGYKKKEMKNYSYKGFFNKSFLGLGIELDFYPPFADKEIHFTFQITLLYWRFWFVLYKK